MFIAPRPARAAFVLFAALVSTASAQQKPLAGFDDYVNRAIRELKHAGIAVAIVRNDSVVYAKGYGVRKVGESAPVDANTIFAIGSSSKAFTGLAAAMLVDQKKMRWDEPLATYLPELRLADAYASKELTVRDALTHRSGLARTDLMWISGQFDSDELIRRLRFVQPSSSFRTQYGYQNLMFLAVGMAVARVSGMPSWAKFVEERIFTPLGMNESSTSIRDLAGKPNVAQPHALVRDTLKTVPFRMIDHVGPAGSINSSVNDMAKWLRFQLAGGKVNGKPLLGEQALMETRTPQFLLRRGGGGANAERDGYFSAYGFGWFLQDYHGKYVVHHGGNIDGMTALVAFMPDENLGVVALTNMNGSPLPNLVVFDVFDRYLGRPSKDRVTEIVKARERQAARARQMEAEAESKRVKGTSPSLPLEKYAGAYADSANGTMKVAVENGKLVVRYGSQFTGDLEHWHFDTFRVSWRDNVVVPGAFISFTIDRSGLPGKLDAGDFGTYAAQR